MKTEFMLRQAAERRRHDRICQAGALAVLNGHVTKPDLARELSITLTEAATLLDELVRLEICIVRYDGEVRSSIDRYPVDPGFLEQCRTKLPAHEFASGRIAEVVKDILRAQEGS